jgi:hypothetical protein
MTQRPLYAVVDYDGKVNDTVFNVPFPYIDKSHVFVYVDGYAVNFTWLADNSIKLNTPLQKELTVRVKRRTPLDRRLVDFQSASVLTEKDLDVSNLQVFFNQQEVEDDLALGLLGADISNVKGDKGDYNEQRFQWSFIAPPKPADFDPQPFGWLPEIPEEPESSDPTKPYHLWMTQAWKRGETGEVISPWSRPVRLTGNDAERLDLKDGWIKRGMFEEELAAAIELDYSALNEAQGLAIAAREEAQIAAQNAADAQASAEQAVQTATQAASSAQSAADAAQATADEAQQTATQAVSDATDALNGAIEAKDEAIVQAGLAVEARGAAVVAYEDAQGAATAALVSKNTAIDASGEAVAAASSAVTASTQADGSAQAALAAETTAVQKATEAAGSAVIAETKAQAAVTAATEADGSATAALVAKTDTENLRDQASTSAQAAVTAATEADGSATAALTAKTDAENAAQAAVTAETNANGSATAALTAKTDAENAASNASTSAQAAVTAATEADGSAQSALTAKTDAVDAASNASTSAQAAATAATEADGSATAALNAKTDAVNAAGNAETSAQAAALAETNADGSATAALVAKTDAENAAEEASTSAQAAATAETNADGHARAALTAQTNAESSAQAAALAETNADGSAQAALTAQTAAETAESNAAGHASTAQTQANAAVSAKTTAEGEAASALTARTEAETARDDAKDEADRAKTQADAAVSARTAADGSASAALTAQTKAETAATNAETHATAAALAETNADGSANAALVAQTAAETAQSAAETAKDDAEAAATEAETQATAAVSAKTSANGSAETALTAQSTTAGYRDTAKTYRDQAQNHRNAADTYSANAQTYRNQALSYRNAAQDAQEIATSEANVAVQARTEAGKSAELVTQVSLVQGFIMDFWEGSVGLAPANNYEEAVNKFSLVSDMEGKAALRVQLIDAEGGGVIAFNGEVIATGFRGENNETKWFEYVVDAKLGDNEVALWRATSDGMTVKRIELRGGDADTKISAVEERVRATEDEAFFSLKVQNDGRVAGIGAIADPQGTALLFQADQIGFTSDATQDIFPFTLRDDVVYIDKARMVTLEANSIVNVESVYSTEKRAQLGNTLIEGTFDLAQAGQIEWKDLDPAFRDNLVMVDPDAEVTGGSRTGVVQPEVGVSKTLWLAQEGNADFPPFLSGGVRQTLRLKVFGGRGYGERDTRPTVAPKATVTVWRKRLDVPDTTVVDSFTFEGFQGKETEVDPPLYWSLISETQDVVMPNTVSGGTYEYYVVVSSVSGDWGTNGSVTADFQEPISSSGGLVANTAWDKISGKPETATRWPTKSEIGLSRVQNIRLNWAWGSSTPTHIWGSQGSSTESYVYNPNQLRDAMNIRWADIESKPATATRWPKWNEVSDKPRIPVIQNSIARSILQNSSTLESGFYSTSQGLPAPDGSVEESSWWHVLNFKHKDNNGYGAQLGIELSSGTDARLQFRTSGSNSNGDTWNNWHKVYSEQHKPTWSEIESKPSSFNPSSHNHSASNITSGTLNDARLPTTMGRKRLQKDAHESGAYESHLELYGNEAATSGEISILFHQGGKFYHQLRARSDGLHVTRGNNNEYNKLHAKFVGDLESSEVVIQGSGTIGGNSSGFNNGWLRVGTSGDGWSIDPNEIYSSGSGNIGTFSGDLNINPAGMLKIKGGVRLNTAASSILQVTNNNGYVRVGANNTGYGHFYTDRPQFYMNQPLQVDGTIKVYNTMSQLQENRLYIGANTSSYTRIEHNGDVLKKSSWSLNDGEQRIIRNSWRGNTGDFMQLQSTGNRTDNGSLAIATNMFAVGRHGYAQVNDSTVNTFDDTWLSVDTTDFYLSGKRVIRHSDSWLRLNEDKSFSSGIYCGGSTLRTDGTLQVGSSGNAFNATTGQIDLKVTTRVHGRLHLKEIVTQDGNFTTIGSGELGNYLYSHASATFGAGHEAVHIGAENGIYLWSHPSNMSGGMANAHSIRILDNQGNSQVNKLTVYDGSSGENSLDLRSGSKIARTFWRSSDDNFGFYINSATRLRWTGNNDRWTFSGEVWAADHVVTSDRRVKDKLEVIDNALDKVDSITGYTYDHLRLNERKAGVIAQDVEEVLPEAVTEDDEGIKNVSAMSVIGLLVNAVKELKDELQELKGVVYG